MCLGGRAARLLARCAAGGAARGARDRRRCAWCDARTAAGRYVAREVRALEKKRNIKRFHVNEKNLLPGIEYEFLSIVLEIFLQTTLLPGGREEEKK